MDLRVAILLTLLSSVLFLGVDGYSPQCCTSVTRRIPKRILKKVLRYEEQSSKGVCDIDALILHTSLKRFPRICAHPDVKKKLDQLREELPGGFSGRIASF